MVAVLERAKKLCEKKAPMLRYAGMMLAVRERTDELSKKNSLRRMDE
jgi:hypothetical protein